ncbi:MAG: hypothetical protein LC723_07155, partial [Actinobacteria bacterium]|nr:hypothetical protein [Actinomycetota bacterium]
MELRDYLHILRRRRWIIAGTLLTILVFTALISWRMTPIYQASSEVEIQGSQADQASQFASFVDPERRIQTQVQLIQSSAVLEKAAKALALPDVADLRGALSVSVVQNSEIVRIAVQHERPEEAKAWADAVAKAYIDLRRERALNNVLAASSAVSKKLDEINASIAEQEKNMADFQQQQDALRAKRATATGADAAQLDSQISGLDKSKAEAKANRDGLVSQRGVLASQQNQLPDAQTLQSGGGNIIGAAETPTHPIKPRKIVNMMLAFILGSGFGVALAFLAENLDDRIRDPQDVEDVVGAPILGFIPAVKEWEKQPSPYLAMVNEPGSGASEAFRTLRTNLRFISLDKPLRTVLITSSVAQEGKSTTAANLAVAFAQGGTKTILLAADLRRPTAHKLFGLGDSKGVVDALDPDYPLEGALQQNSVPN